MKANITKKFAAFGLVLLFVLQTLSIGAEPERSTVNDRANEVAAVMDYLLGNDFFDGESVTRAEFTGALVRVFSLYVDGDIGGFSDVNTETPYAAEITSALSAGLISHAEQFEPLQPVEYEHAVKMVIHALGYEALANEYGGYPQGYIQAAKQLKLLERVPREQGGMSADGVRTLLYNLLNSIIRCTGVDTNAHYIQFEKTDTNYLESLYNLQMTEGIVTATQYNSYRVGAELQNKPSIEVEGVRYSSEQDNPALLGYNVRVYYDIDTNSIKVIAPYQNREIEVSLNDVKKLDLNTLQYNDPVSGKNRSYQTNGCIIVYNGRAVETLDFDSVLKESGTVRLLDNNNDGKYEYLFLNCYQYLYASQVDVRGKSISDTNDFENSITANTPDTVLVVQDENGRELEISDVKKGSLLAVERSMDNALICARLCTRQLLGTITRIGAENKIYIDDAVYQLSSYAKEHYAAQIIPGSKGSFLIGRNNEIVVLSGTANAMQYGYLVNGAIVGVLDEQLKLRIYTQGGELEEFIADKIYLDTNQNKVNAVSAFTAFSQDGEVKPQLIRYRTDAERKMITHIDLAATEFDFTDRPQNDEDSLRKFSFTKNGTPVTSFRYRSSGKTCSPYFNLNNTVVFSVPKEADIKNAKQQDFRISDASGLMNDRTYSFEVYDLNEGGTAGAVVLKGDRLGSNRNYMVESVAEGILPDDTVGTIIHAYGYQSYGTFYIPSEIEETLQKELCAGDIIEVISDDKNVIRQFALVFDSSSGMPVPNTSAGGNIRFESETSTSYFYGSLYAKDSAYAYLSKTENGEGGYRYEWQDLINLRLQTNNMALINAKRNEIRPITMQELKEHKLFGENNYYIVVHMSNQSPDAVYAYER